MSRIGRAVTSKLSTQRFRLLGLYVRKRAVVPVVFCVVVLCSVLLFSANSSSQDPTNSSGDHELCIMHRWHSIRTAMLMASNRALSMQVASSAIYLDVKTLLICVKQPSRRYSGRHPSDRPSACGAALQGSSCWQRPPPTALSCTSRLNRRRRRSRPCHAALTGAPTCSTTLSLPRLASAPDARQVEWHARGEIQAGYSAGCCNNATLHIAARCWHLSL